MQEAKTCGNSGCVIVRGFREELFGSPFRASCRWSDLCWGQISSDGEEPEDPLDFMWLNVRLTGRLKGLHRAFPSDHMKKNDSLSPSKPFFSSLSCSQLIPSLFLL